MKAALLYEPKIIKLTEVDEPQPGPDDVLIKPYLTGVCGSDTSLFTGHRTAIVYPLLLGHEVVGEVVGVGNNVKQINVGQRVIVEPNFTCGVCSFCRSGRGNICPDKKSLGVNIPGCFADWFISPAEFVWPIPDSICNDDAVTIEPLAVSLHALWQSGVQLGDSIAVIGCGATGLLLIQSAVVQGVNVIAHDVIASKIDAAAELGALVFSGTNVTSLWKDHGVTAVFECAGASSTVEMALDSVPRGGQVILLGLSTATAHFTPLNLVRQGLRVSGSIIYDHPTDFSRAIALVEKQVLSPKKIVTNTFPFSDIGEALKLASTGTSGKILITMTS